MQSMQGIKPKKYEISSGPAFKFEVNGDFVYVEQWFEQLGKSVHKWIEDVATKRLLVRIQPLIDGPAIMPQPEHTEKKDAGDNANYTHNRVAVNKYVVPAILSFLKNEQLRVVVNNHMEVNTLVSVKCESIHIRTTDGWFSVSAASKYHGFKLDDFIKSSQLKNMVSMFGDIIVADPIKGSDDQSTIWMHPVGILPLMLWIDTQSTLELMASFFMSGSETIPNFDAMKMLIEKNIKLRAQAKAQSQTLEEINYTSPSNSNDAV